MNAERKLEHAAINALSNNHILGKLNQYGLKARVIKAMVEYWQSLTTPAGNAVVVGEWQLCPKCNGEGTITPAYYSTNVMEQCDVCFGAKIIQKPVITFPSKPHTVEEGQTQGEDEIKQEFKELRVYIEDRREDHPLATIT